MQEPLGESWVAGLIGAALGSAGLWAYLSERLKARRSPPAAMVSAEGEFAEAAAEFSKRFGEAAAGLVDHLRKELQFVRGQVDELRQKVDACEDRHRICEQQLAQIRAENQQIRLRLQGEIPFPTDY